MIGSDVSRWFSVELLNWYAEHGRTLPWRESRDPYVIWVTEIIFQQTRIEQGLSYYHRFLSAYPDVFALARAHDDEVMKVWEGLGYYNRARNLLFSARRIVGEYSGCFPDTYSGWLDLKGIGEYTASIIASVCLNEPQAAVDGNVLRVLSRFFRDDTPIDTSGGKSHYRSLAQLLIDPKNPGDFNQGMMDLGAGICTPRDPDCIACPLNSRCGVLKAGKPTELPRKINKKSSRLRYLNYFRISNEHAWFVRKRSSSEIWPDLFEYPLIEGDLDLLSLKALVQSRFGIQISSLPEPEQKTHLLTHQKLIIRIFTLRLPGLTDIPGYVRRTSDQISGLSFPRPLQR